MARGFPLNLKSWRFAALVLAALAAGAGCTRGAARPEIAVHLPAEPVTLDPALAEDDFAVKVLCNTMDGLVGYDNAGKLVNKLAERFEIGADGKRYVFTLRPSAKWSDGKAVTAADFVTGIRRSLAPKTASKLANLLFAIKGAKAFSLGKAPIESVGVHEQNGKLVIELERPTSYFLHVLTLAQTAPARADILAANGGEWPAAAPSTGPYKIEAYTREVEIKLVPNPLHWRGRAALLTPVTFKIIPDESQAISLFETGKLDVVGRVPPLDLERMRAKGFVREFYQIATFFLAFNTSKPPFDDRVFRRAVAGAIDREGIVKIIGTASRPARSWIPPPLEGFIDYADPRPGFADSVTSVRAQIAKGFSTPVTAALSASNQNTVIMEKIQDDLKTKLGLKVGLSTLDFKAYVTLLGTDTPQIYRYQRGAPFMDPIWHLLSFTGGDANNFTHWKSAEYDRLVDEISTTPPGHERLAKILRAQKILVDDEAVCVPVFHAWQTHLVAKRLRGYAANPVNEVHYDEVSLQ